MRYFVRYREPNYVVLDYGPNVWFPDYVRGPKARDEGYPVLVESFPFSGEGYKNAVSLMKELNND